MEFVGLFGGMALGLLGWYIGRAAARRNPGLDEMHEYIWRKARSVSWYVTLGAIYVLLILALFRIEIGLVPALAILLLVHLVSWAVAGVSFIARLTEGDGTGAGKAQRLLVMIIGMVFLIGFGIASVLLENWMMMLFSMIPISFMVILVYAQSRTRKDHEQPRDQA